MSPLANSLRRWQSDPRGFTLIEVIVVFALIGILAGFATPTFMEIAENSRFRETTRNLASAFREARSLAVNTNREHRVEIDAANRRVRLIEGDLAASNNWNVPPSTIVRQWEIPAMVDFDPPLSDFTFSPNGSAAPDGGINILDGADTVRFRVLIASTGRVRIR